MAMVPPALPDEDIINELVASQEVPVVPKLQSLLRSICSRLALQGSKIEKAEEQGRIAALLKDEFEHLSKSALENLKAEKEADKNDWLKLIEDKLKGIDEITKQYGDMVSALQDADLSILKTLPSRLSALEERTELKDVKASEANNETSQKEENTSCSEDDSTHHSPHQSSNLQIDGRMEALQSDFDDQNDKITRLEDQIKELKATMQDAAKAYSSDIDSLQKICRNLRSDIELLPILDMSGPRDSVQGAVPVNPDNTAALIEIQNRLQRKADNDTVDLLIRSTAQAKEGFERMKLLVDELKQQVRATAPPASRRASSMNIHAPPMGIVTAELAPQKDMEADPKIICEIISEGKVEKSADGELYDDRLKQLENELVALATQLAGKADRKDLNGLQIQMTLLEEHRPNNLSSSLATFSPDGILMETSPGQEIKESLHMNYPKEEKDTDLRLGQRDDDNHYDLQQHSLQQEKPLPEIVPSMEFQKLNSAYVSLQASLQKLQELISVKADRDELLQLVQSVYRRKSEFPAVPHIGPQLSPLLTPLATPIGGGDFENEQYLQMYKQMMIEMENINNKLKKLEERSDLNVLITKRLENFAQPAATVPQTSQGLDEVKAAINEHADRMMEYADTLLQMEALLASKADAAGLQALRQSILELKKRSKDHSFELHPPSMKQDELPGRQMSASEKVEKHEMLLKKLLKDIELLGTGVLTLSGHNLSDIKDTQMHPKRSNLEELQTAEGPPIDSSVVAIPLPGKYETHSTAASGTTESALQNLSQAHDTKEHESNKNMDQIIMEPAVMAKSSADHHDTFLELEEALHENLIKPKGDAETVKKIAEEFLPLSVKMQELNDTIRDLQDNTAEKDDLQKMKTYLKQRLDRAETAMFSGKGLPGFKCMSCAHRLEMLNPNRAEFVPTNSMRRQVLPMQAAERLYHKDGEMESPRMLGGVSPTSDHQSNAFHTNSMQLLSPGPLEAQDTSNTKPRIAAKKK